MGQSRRRTAARRPPRRGSSGGGEARDAPARAEPIPGGMVVDAVLRPVRGGNVYEEAVERLLQAIKLGIVPQGERLPTERDLAHRLGVSRVTVRGALRALQEAGFVESRRGRYGGTFVVYRPEAQPRHKRIPSDLAAALSDVLTLRSALEPGAAALAAARDLGPRARAALCDRLRRTETADLAAYRQADSWLHLTIAELVGSPSLLAAVADVRARINELLDAIPLLPPNIEHANAQHRAIVEAILAGDPDEARRTMEEHLEGTAALLRGFLG